MLNQHQNEALNTIRYQEHLQEANNSRLAAQSEQSKRAPFFAPALAQLGSTMIALGNDLQDRYGELCDDVQQPAVAPKPATR